MRYWWNIHLYCLYRSRKEHCTLKLQIRSNTRKNGEKCKILWYFVRNYLFYFIFYFMEFRYYGIPKFPKLKRTKNLYTNTIKIFHFFSLVIYHLSMLLLSLILYKAIINEQFLNILQCYFHQQVDLMTKWLDDLLTTQRQFSQTYVFFCSIKTSSYCTILRLMSIHHSFVQGELAVQIYGNRRRSYFHKQLFNNDKAIHAPVRSS